MPHGPMHFPRLPDWLIYLSISVAILVAALGRQENADAPEPPPPVAGEEALPLGPASPFDPGEVVAAPGRRRLEVGTAFSIADEGVWVTARHVVDNCRRVALLVAEGRGVAATVHKDPKADLAILITEGGAPALPLLASARLEDGQRGFHPGFPQGGPGEAASRYLGRERLPARRRGDVERSVLAWSESGRTRGVTGSLEGLSGAPVLDSAGRVMGVTLAEQPRRGRLYTTGPGSIARARAAAEEDAAFAVGEAITTENYGRVADALRRDLRLVQVVCLRT